MIDRLVGLPLWFQMCVKVEKSPELGFSISGGVGGRGNPFRPEDNVSLHSGLLIVSLN